MVTILFRRSVLLQSFILCFLVFSSLRSQTTVTSLKDLASYLGKSNNHIKLKKGTYTITRDDIEKKTYSVPIFNLTGNKNIIDFSGSTIKFETEAFEIVMDEFLQFNIDGEGNVVKNLIFQDVGDSRPYKVAQMFHLGGSDNTLENINMTVRGSNPYAYGDLFGKGRDYVIKHHKHAAVRVTGYRNHVLNCTIIHRAYGHGIFVQGGIDTLIEGCYLEGEMRSTDEVLAEKGTEADKVDFMTVFGYKVPKGFMFSLQEEGIRAYSSGKHKNGKKYETENMIVKDCTVKNFRGGFSIGFTDGEKRLENCTAIGCETAFWLGKGGEIINCAADAQYGPIYFSQSQYDKDIIGDITILDSDPVYGNQGVLCYFAGNKNNLTFKNGTKTANKDLKIIIGGEAQQFKSSFNFSSDECTIMNHTPYSMIINGNKHTIKSCGSVTDKGSNNDIKGLDDCDTVNFSSSGDGANNEVVDEESKVEQEKESIKQEDSKEEQQDSDNEESDNQEGLGRLLFNENFDTFNFDYWNIGNGISCSDSLDMDCGDENNELQYFSSDNIGIEVINKDNNNKALVLQATRTENEGMEFTSAMLDSSSKVSVQYGMIAARVKIPRLDNGLGISILTTDPYYIQQEDYEQIIKPNQYLIYRLYWTSQETYLVITNPNTSDEYRIDIPKLTTSKDNTLDLIFKLFIGGDLLSITDSEKVTANLPAKAYIDYVRVYQYNGEGSVHVEGKEVSSKQLITSDNVEIENMNYSIFNTEDSLNTSLYIQDPTQVEALDIYDINGRIVYRQSSFGSSVITKLNLVDHLDKGLYFVNMLFKNGQTVIKRIVF